MLTLCPYDENVVVPVAGAGAVVVTPKYGLPLAASVHTSGGSGLFQPMQLPWISWELQAPIWPCASGVPPLALRSAGSCSSKIALGLIGFGCVAVGAVTPRANPRPSHSLVTLCQTPVESLYSTYR